MTYVKQGALDLEACENEPIAHIGAVQISYALAIFDPGSRRIRAVSADLAPRVGRDTGNLEGARVDDLFADWPAALDRAAALDVEPVPARTIAGHRCTLRIRVLGTTAR